MHKAPPPMPDTSKLKGCSLWVLIPVALVVGSVWVLMFWSLLQV